jgi:hypothetical protein
MDSRQYSSFVSFAKEFGKPELVQCIEKINYSTASQLTFLFISGAQNQDFTLLLSFIAKELPEVLSPVKNLLQQTTITINPYNNSTVLAQINQQLTFTRNICYKRIYFDTTET